MEIVQQLHFSDLFTHPTRRADPSGLETLNTWKGLSKFPPAGPPRTSASPSRVDWGVSAQMDAASTTTIATIMMVEMGEKARTKGVALESVDATTNKECASVATSLRYELSRARVINNETKGACS